MTCVLHHLVLITLNDPLTRSGDSSHRSDAPVTNTEHQVSERTTARSHAASRRGLPDPHLRSSETPDHQVYRSCHLWNISGGGTKKILWTWSFTGLLSYYWWINLRCNIKMYMYYSSPVLYYTLYYYQFCCISRSYRKTKISIEKERRCMKKEE